MNTNILFITNNSNKINEYKSILPQNINLYSLSDLNIITDFNENGRTFEENAKIKLNSIDVSNYPFLDYVISEDSGLCIDSLGGNPGVLSKRYSGGNDNDNNLLVLEKLKGELNREAYFIANIGLKDIKSDEIINIEGIVNGTISSEVINSGEGFAYDFIFIPTGYDKVFSELGNDIKNEISHRKLAIAKLLDFLEKNN